MPARKATKTSGVPQKHLPPAATPEERENQLIALAYDLVEQRLLDGTATSQETVHFLRMGSLQKQYELEKIKKENELLAAKAESIQSTKRSEELYAAAIAAMHSYSPHPVEEEEDDDPYVY